MEDPMLDPEKYEDREVLWVETKRNAKIWPYHSRLWKQVYTRKGVSRIDPNPSFAQAPWHAPFAETDKAKNVQ
jgi:hypothetical protein